METIQRAASAATDAIFGEHGEHGQGTTQAGTRTDAAGERSHEPLSGRTGDTKIGEPYDAGNLDETSQQRIAASRGEPTTTTGGYISNTTGGYTSNASDTTNTSTTATAGGYVPATSSTTASSTGEGEPRRSSDISPRSGPAAGTIPIPSTADRHAGGGSYSSARETAARAMSAAETPWSGAGAGAAAGGAGLWSAGKRAEEVEGERDENGYRPGEEGYTGKGTEGGAKGQQGQHGQQTRFAGAGGDADAADVTPSRAHAEGKKVKDVGETGTSGSTGAGVGATSAGAAGAGAAGAGAATGDAAGEGAPRGRRESMTGHLPGAPGGEGLRRTSGEGTGEQWVKSSGMKADGGDFDASAPGAGREADRLLTEKGIKRSGADEKKVTGQMDTKAPNGGNNAEGEKLGGLKDKLKDKLKHHP